MTEQKMSTGAKVAIGVGVAGVLGALAYRYRPQIAAALSPSPIAGTVPLPAATNPAAVVAAAPPAPAASAPPAPPAAPPATAPHGRLVYPPGTTVTTAIHSGKQPGAQRWTVGADGRPKTKVGPWMPLTPALQQEIAASVAQGKPAPASSPASPAARPGGPPQLPAASSSSGGFPGMPGGLPTSPQGAMAAGQSLLGALGGAGGKGGNPLADLSGLLGGGSGQAPGGGSGAPTDLGGGVSDGGDAGGGGDPPMAGVDAAGGAPWRMVDPSWRPILVRDATADDIRRTGQPGFPGAKVFRVPADVDGSWTDLGGRTAVGWYVNAGEPWRGASVGDSPPGEILPLITRGGVSGYPIDPLDWSKGIA